MLAKWMECCDAGYDGVLWNIACVYEHKSLCNLMYAICNRLVTGKSNVSTNMWTFHDNTMNTSHKQHANIANLAVTVSQEKCQDVVLIRGLWVAQWKRPWGQINTEMSSYQYKNLCYKGKTVSRWSYLSNGHPYTWKYGARLNTKMPSYQYRDPHVKDKTVSRPSYLLTWESPYLGKTVFILRRDHGLYI